MNAGLRKTEARSFKVAELLDLVQTGTLRIPRFQRGLRWGPLDASRLFDSIYQGFPIGTILLWKSDAPAGQVEIGPVTVDGSDRSDALWVVDGQQRITALAATLLSVERGTPLSSPLYFDLANERFVRTHGRVLDEQCLPLRHAHELPVVLGWLASSSADDDQRQAAFRLADRLRNFEVPAYIVETAGNDVRPLREIFDRINSFGKRMQRSEVFRALTAGADEGADDLMSLGDAIAASEFGAVDEGALMKCVLAVRGSDVLRDFRAETSDPIALAQTMTTARRALSTTLEFLRSIGVPHYDMLPYQHLLVTLMRFFVLHPNPPEWDRVQLRRWFWRAAVSGPLPKMGSTGTLRLALNSIDESSSSGSIIRLLEAFPQERKEPVADALHWGRADVRTTLCALADLRPRGPATSGAAVENELDIGRLLRTQGRSGIQPVFRADVDGGIACLGNQAFWPLSDNEEHLDESGDEAEPRGLFAGPDTSVSDEDDASSGVNGEQAIEPALYLANADEEFLASHCVSAEAAAALRQGDASAFVRARSSDVQQATADFVDARAEWDRDPRPAITVL